MSLTKKGELITSWDADNNPEIWLDYPLRWEDVTRQPQTPTDPNSVIISFKCSDATLTALEADSRVFVICSDNIEGLHLP